MSREQLVPLGKSRKTPVSASDRGGGGGDFLEKLVKKDLIRLISSLRASSWNAGSFPRIMGRVYSTKKRNNALLLLLIGKKRESTNPLLGSLEETTPIYIFLGRFTGYIISLAANNLHSAKLTGASTSITVHNQGTDQLTSFLLFLTNKETKVCYSA